MKYLLYKWTLILMIACSQANTSWVSPSTNQYHIQTDEGPERYFRYQTDNGQYRKEKRLKDGTVIGTDAWIDASGILRQNDYIADAEGYRIIKSKTVYVGKDHPIEDALKSFKHGESQSNIPLNQQNLLRSKTISSINNHVHSTSSKWLYPGQPLTPSNYIELQSKRDRFSTSPTSAPFFIEKHALTNSLYKKDRIPSIKIEPPYKYPATTVESPANNARVVSVQLNLPSSTSSPVSLFTYPTKDTGSVSTYPTHFSTLNTELLPPLAIPSQESSEVDNSIDSFVSTTLHPTSFPSQNFDEFEANKEDSRVQPFYTRPLTLNQHSSSDYTVNNQKAYKSNFIETQSPSYEGSVVNGNSFHYFLPRHYHEEVSNDAQHRAGSFGYIDPFGIRRVIYYASTPERGFLHRKNNRFVGFNATPYDPEPSK